MRGDGSGFMRVAGGISLVAGVLMTLHGCTASDAAPGSTTINFGLMVDNLTSAVVGAALLITGMIGFAAADIITFCARPKQTNDRPQDEGGGEP